MTAQVKPEISIIVPIYKVELYLKKCVDSILAQTFKDFELILVNDGSPDGCGDICEAYKALDPRVVVIHKQNGGCPMPATMELKWQKAGISDSWTAMTGSSRICMNPYIPW